MILFLQLFNAVVSQFNMLIGTFHEVSGHLISRDSRIATRMLVGASQFDLGALRVVQREIRYLITEERKWLAFADKFPEHPRPAPSWARDFCLEAIMSKVSHHLPRFHTFRACVARNDTVWALGSVCLDVPARHRGTAGWRQRKRW